jgi:hypothetical protein
MSKALKKSPAEVIGITDDLAAYAFNSSVVLWGTSFDAALEEAVRGAKSTQEAENKQRSVVYRWIPSARKYR